MSVPGSLNSPRLRQALECGGLPPLSKTRCAPVDLVPAALESGCKPPHSKGQLPGVRSDDPTASKDAHPLWTVLPQQTVEARVRASETSIPCSFQGENSPAT